MKNLRNKTNFLLIGTLVITAIFSPFLGTGVLSNANGSDLSEFKLKSDYLSNLTSDQGNSENPDSLLSINKQDSIFGDLLIKSFESIQDSEDTDVKIIMLFEEGTSKSERIEVIDSILDEYKIIDNYDIIPAVYLQCDPNELFSKKEQLEEKLSLEKVYKSNVYKMPYYTENLPETSALSSNNYPNWWIPAIGAEDLPYNGSGVRVAVLDTGIYEHPDLNIVASRNFVSGESSFDVFDYYGHGTHVGGIIGGNGSSSNGIYRGVAPGVSLINAKSGGLSGLEEGDVISAIEWSVNTAGADILSMSFGDDNPIVNDPIIQALTVVTELGVICVASAGNSGPEYISGGSPASGIDVISVGASDSNNNLAFFSSWGPSLSYLSYPDVVAPGVNIISTEAPESAISDEYRFIGDYIDYAGDGDYIPLSGTSMSCPMVSGALAILKQAYPALTPEAARIALLKGAQTLSNIDDAEFLKSGYGLINVTASLKYLEYLNTTYFDYNDAAKITPNVIPIKPYDLLHFPGDKQLFNMTVISGQNVVLDIDLPSDVDGLSLSTDTSQITFTDAGADFVALSVEIEPNATPGTRVFGINITSGIRIYDTVEVSIEVRLPEYKILMESYHGLNDWYSELSFYQMDFSNWMRDIMELNISIDYLAELWTPNYNRFTSNSLLTEELLAQYDLIVLQSPILPFNPLEFKNLKEYFDGGGNILFLGTRYQDLCVDNINNLFSYLNLGIEINEENLADETWLGLGATVSSQSITDLTHAEIFQNVSKFIWDYGTTLSVTGTAEVIAASNGNILAAAYDNRGSGGGRFVAFGDLHWATELYESSSYRQDHQFLTRNLMNYFLDSEDVSIDIVLPSESTPSPQLNISVFVKDRIGDVAIDSAYLNTHLNVSIENEGYFEKVDMISSSDGISINSTFTLPTSSAKPYVIKANLTYGGSTYNKISKVLYYNSLEMPQILSLISSSDLERNGMDPLDIYATLDGGSYNVTSYLSIMPFSYYNDQSTLNKTFVLSNTLPNPFQYYYSYTPTSVDPSGYVIHYILPYNSTYNYLNPHSPRVVSTIVNNPPEFIEESSSFTLIDSSAIIFFDETHTEDTVNVYTASQGDQIKFDVNVTDSVSYEDQDSSEMRVSVNLFIVSITEDNYIVPINPRNYIVSELGYVPSSNIHSGSFSVPYTMNFASITGTKKLSTASQYDTTTQDGYIAIFWITVFDSEGESEDFIIAFLIQASPEFNLILILVIVGIVVVSGIFLGILLILRKKRKSRISTPTYEPYYGDESIQEPYEHTQVDVIYCPYCGYHLTSKRNFCPSCGKSLKLQE